MILLQNVKRDTISKLLKSLLQNYTFCCIVRHIYITKWYLKLEAIILVVKVKILIYIKQGIANYFDKENKYPAEDITPIYSTELDAVYQLL